MTSKGLTEDNSSTWRVNNAWSPFFPSLFLGPTLISRENYDARKDTEVHGLSKLPSIT